MTWKLYEFVDARGNRLLRQELLTLLVRNKRMLGRVQAKIDSLAQNGPDLPPKLLSPTPKGRIKKLRINGHIAVRIMVCAGPIDAENEYTLLLAAQEKNGKLVYPNAYQVADDRRREIEMDHKRRRVYERITKTTD
jgi:hypothetical protein